jgi:hypothetical protein
LNYVSRYAFAHDKLSNQVGLQDGTCQDIRSRFGLPAQMACSVPRQVGATYKALWTKVKANAVARAGGKTKKRYRDLDQAPKYVSPTLTYQLGHDYGFKSGQHVSILMLAGRVILPYSGYARHAGLIQRGAQIGAAKLWYDKPHKQVYLLVSLEVEVADPTPAAQQRIVGVGSAVSCGGHGHARPHGFLLWQTGAGEGGPLCSTEKAVAAHRHSFGDATTGRHCRARETVEAGAQPSHQ